MALALAVGVSNFPFHLSQLLWTALKFPGILPEHLTFSMLGIAGWKELGVGYPLWPPLEK